MEFRADAKLEGVDRAVVGHRPALRQRGQDLAAGADAGQALEDVGIEHFVDGGGSACRRIEMRRLERHAEYEICPRGLRWTHGGEANQASRDNRFPRLHRHHSQFLNMRGIKA